MNGRADYVRARVSGLPDGKWERRVFMVQAFFDESGNAPDQGLLVMGGLIAPADAWVQFTKDWEEARARAPGAEFIKYSEIIRGEGQFSDERGWTDDLREERLQEFGGIIKNHCMGMVWTAIEHAHFEKHVASIRLHYRNALSDLAYTQVALKSIGPTLALLLRLGVREKCDFYFDQVTGPDRVIHELWPSIQSISDDLPEEFAQGQQAPPIGSLSFENELEYVPLQGADIVAGLLRDVTMLGFGPAALKSLQEMPFEGQILDEQDVIETGRMLQERIDRLIAVNPNARLFDYDPKTAARTRKKLERWRREALKKNQAED